MASHFDRGSCDEEEEYQSISEADEESQESTEAALSECGNNTPESPRASPEEIYTDLYPSKFVNTSNTNVVNRIQAIPARQTFLPYTPTVNIMVGFDIKLPIFNGNGLEDPKQHWFLCEFIWIMRQIQDENIKRAQMITTL